MPNQFKPNPELYKRLATPRPRAVVEASIQAFDADVQAARERHGIAELLCVVGAVVAGEGTIVAVSNYGSAAKMATLALAAKERAREIHMAIFDEVFAADGAESDDEEPSK